jgi:hypothetical protein
MAFVKPRDFQCDVVNENVRICLRNRSTAGLQGMHVLFVVCDQSECQHVDANKPPCPLTLALFADEIRAREESARLRRSLQ